MYLVSIGTEAYLVRDLPKWKAALALLAGILCIVPEHFTDIIGIAVLVYLHMTEKKALKAMGITEKHIPGREAAINRKQQ